MSTINFGLSTFSDEPDVTSQEPAPRVWSPQQLAVRDWVRTGRGNAILMAVAGSGKSTTLIEVVLPELWGFVDVVVYNKRAERDLVEKKSKVEDRLKCRGLQIGTFHRFGLNAWRRSAPDVLIEGYDGPSNQGKAAGYLKFDRIFDELKIDEIYQPFVKKLVGAFKQQALGIHSPASIEECLRLVTHFDMDMELADNYGRHRENYQQLVADGMHYAIQALTHSNQIAREVIDFDDMIYLPLQANCKMFSVDWLLVDESQDLTPARRFLCRKMLKPGGRALFVGDSRQAIYSWQGADSESMDRIKEEFGCIELPLSVSFRCPQNVVKHAQQYVSHIEAAPTAPLGEVKFITEKEFLQIKFNPDDAIICRKNAPLVDLAFAFIRNGQPCRVEGREIGRSILSLAEKWKIVRLEPLVVKLNAYKHREVNRLMSRGHESTADALADRVETLLALIAGMPPGSTVADLKGKIQEMFEDSEGNKKRVLTLMSIHKSKGLEYNHVYLFGSNKFQPSPYARQAWQLREESNLRYVMITRAKQTLTEVIVS